MPHDPHRTASSSTEEPEIQLVAARIAARLVGRIDPVRIGRYTIVRRIGEGGMGVVYAARDEELGRDVAIKLLKVVHKGHARRERLRREARAMARVVHDNVARVFEIGEQRGRTFVVMELVRGSTLRAWIEQARPDASEIVARYVEAGRGIVAAHAVGIVHRDFKPDNAILGVDGRVRVLDFGLASVGAELTDEQPSGTPRTDPGDGPLTRTGTVLGTPQYMAPEQFRGEHAGPAADQFALCVSVFEALFGVPPFAGTTAQEVHDAKLRGGVREPAALDRRARRLRAVLVRGLAARPEDRWPHMDALLRALERERAGGRRHTTTMTGAVVLAGLSAAVWQGGATVHDDRVHAQALDACEHDGDASTMWNDDLRRQVRDALDTSRLPHAAGTGHRVLPALDRYAQQWQDIGRQLCVAGLDDATSPDTDARARWCLDERRVAMTSLVEQLVHADDDAVTFAVTAVANLPSIEACRDAALLSRQPAPPSDRRAVIAAAHVELGRADALRRAGRIDPAIAASEAALASATATDWPALSAAAHATFGRALAAAARYTEAEAQLAAAYFLAVDAGAYEVAVDAAADLVDVVGVQLARRSEGLAWVRHGDAALRLLGDGEGLVAARLLERESELRGAMIELAAAERLAERVLEIRERTLGPDHPLVGDAAYLVAMASELRDEARSSAAATRAVRIAETALGVDHPDLVPRLLLASAARPHDEATALVLRALTISERTYGPDHPRVASALVVLGRLTYWKDGEAAARPHVERALAIQTATLGPAHADIARTVNLLGLLAHPRPEAIALYQRALAIAEQSLGPLHPFVAPPLYNLAELHRMRGEPELALPLIRRAAEVRHHVFGDTPRYSSYLSGVGMLERCLGHADEAQRVYAEVAAIEPRSPRPRLVLADLALERGDPTTALTFLRRAIELAPVDSTGRRDDEPFWLLGDFTHAQVSWSLPEAAGRDRPQALALARGVARRLEDPAIAAPEEACGGRDGLRARVDAWLGTHTLPR